MPQIRKAIGKYKTVIIFFYLFQLSIFPATAQKSNADTVRVRLEEAEKIFLLNNLGLLAQQYNVDINKAFVQQAKYWDNPILITDQSIYDGKFFRHNKDFGQIYLQLQQLIKTAGKRNKQIQLAKDQVLTADQQFNDLLRNLRFLLRSDFHLLNQQYEIIAIYNNEIEILKKLAAGMDAQLQVGNISQKDNLRIKALLFNTQSDAADLQRQITDAEKDFLTLLQVNGDTVYVPVLAETQGSVNTLNLLQLLDSAKVNRPDLHLAKTNILIQQHNLSLQKALVAPDVTVGVEYDRLSSYVPNLWGLNISLPLPILNKNQGNIKAAQYSIKQAAIQAQQVELVMEHQVKAAYSKYLTAQKLQQVISSDFMTKYNLLMKNMVQSYQDRQISLLEFIDFFAAYKEAMTKQITQQTNLRNAAEELNFTVGTTIITTN